MYKLESFPEHAAQQAPSEKHDRILSFLLVQVMVFRMSTGRKLF